MATKDECNMCPKNLECPILEGIEAEELLRAKCTEWQREEEND